MPWWFPLIFVGMWLVVGGLLAGASGWVGLARRYRTYERPLGKRIRFQVDCVGWVSENNVTGIIVAQGGLYLYANPLFRFLRPPLLVPWAEIRFVREARVLWMKRYVLDLGSITTLRVKPAAYDHIKKYLHSGHTPPN